MMRELSTITSIVAAITANQEQVDWWLRVIAAVVAIVAGVISIVSNIRRRRRHD